MRNVTLLDNVDASTQQVSDGVNLERRTDWELIIESSGTDAVPQLFIEKGYNAGASSPLPVEWFLIPNCCDDDNSFLLEDSEIQIVNSGFTANWFRIRVEPNGNTTGNITAKIHYKEYP